jgi:hypothetical protein
MTTLTVAEAEAACREFAAQFDLREALIKATGSAR